MVLISRPLKSKAHFFFQRLCCLSNCTTPQLINLYHYTEIRCFAGQSLHLIFILKKSTLLTESSDSMQKKFVDKLFLKFLLITIISFQFKITSKYTACNVLINNVLNPKETVKTNQNIPSNKTMCCFSSFAERTLWIFSFIFTSHWQSWCR